MALDEETLQSLKGFFDDRYVLKRDCSEKQENINQKISKDELKIEIIAHDFKIIKWLISVVAAASGGSLLTSIIDLFTK